jgi:hypothetical protein
MGNYENEAQDLLVVISDKDAEIEALRDEMQELVGWWMFAECHQLKICDVTWLQHNKIVVSEAPDGAWVLEKKGRRLQKAATVRMAVDVLRTFWTEA